MYIYIYVYIYVYVYVYVYMYLYILSLLLSIIVARHGGHCRIFETSLYFIFQIAKIKDTTSIIIKIIIYTSKQNSPPTLMNLRGKSFAKFDKTPTGYSFLAGRFPSFPTYFQGRWGAFRPSPGNYL